jgi:superfamily I DNA/RNA helicase
MVITTPEKSQYLSPYQKELIAEPLDSHLWVSGPAGSGKTTASTMRLLAMVKQGIPADEILILLPQRTLAQPYSSLLASPEFPPGGRPDILTLNGLAQRSISLFWPLVSASAGF